jgi:hypothetical protein
MMSSPYEGNRCSLGKNKKKKPIETDKRTVLVLLGWQDHYV